MLHANLNVVTEDKLFINNLRCVVYSLLNYKIISLGYGYFHNSAHSIIQKNNNNAIQIFQRLCRDNMMRDNFSYTEYYIKIEE